MSRSHTTALFSHLTLALSGVALACSGLDFLPEAPALLLVYLTFIWLSWHGAGRWCLPTWGANLLGLLIATAAVWWIMARLSDSDTNEWLRDVPVTAAVVPYLGPVLMALLLVRLYRPRSSGDFWVLQGLGLLQVALGCVLSSSTIFGVALLAYLSVALCTLAAHERHRQEIYSTLGVVGRGARLSGSLDAGQAARRGGGWLRFGLRWTAGVALLALPLFLITPRASGPEWEPWARFGLRQPRKTVASTGFSEDMDLNRSGRIENEESVAFTVSATTPAGRAYRNLPADQRWRGIVLDRYEEGVWRSSLSWSARPGLHRSTSRYLDQGPDVFYLEFRVPGRTGGLFLAEPVGLGPLPGTLPIWTSSAAGQNEQVSLFSEVEGTVSPIGFLPRNEYRYHQAVSLSVARDRYRAWRIRDGYFQRLVRFRQSELETWTRQTLARLAAREGAPFASLGAALRENAVSGDPLPPMHWEAAATLLHRYLVQSGDFSYSLTYTRQSRAMDPVLDFLVNVRQGPCERFASALALALRSQRIPARVIKGFRGAEQIGDGVFQVRNLHAHAWVEVLVLSPDGPKLTFDWLVLDPTPDNEAVARSTSALARWWQLQQAVPALWHDLIVGYGAGQQAELIEDLLTPGRGELLLALAGGVVIVGLSIWLWRRRARRSRVKQSDAAALYSRLVALLQRRLGVVAAIGETPRELAGRSAELLASRPSVAALVSVPAEVVTLFYVARYGGHSPVEDELIRTRERLEALEVALAG